MTKQFLGETWLSGRAYSFYSCSADKRIQPLGSHNDQASKPRGLRA
jgi:hypothetical protein